MLALTYAVLIERQKYLKCYYQQNKMYLKKRKQLLYRQCVEMEQNKMGIMFRKTPSLYAF